MLKKKTISSKRRYYFYFEYYFSPQVFLFLSHALLNFKSEKGAHIIKKKRAWKNKGTLKLILGLIISLRGLAFGTFFFYKKKCVP